MFVKISNKVKRMSFTKRPLCSSCSIIEATHIIVEPAHPKHSTHQCEECLLDIQTIEYRIRVEQTSIVYEDYVVGAKRLTGGVKD